MVAIYSYRKMKSIDSNVEFNGFIYYDRLNNEILEVPRYQVSSDICRYLKAAFAEDKKLEKNWDKQPISTIEENIESENEIYIESKYIIMELIEYCVLDQLSMGLDDYFRKKDMNFEKLEKIERDNIPKELLANRFINLFSKDFKTRKAFANYHEDLRRGDELFGIENFETGEIYNKIQLIFPKGTKIKKDYKESLQINTKKYVIDIKFDFEGIEGLRDNIFEKYYLNVQNYCDDDLNFRYCEYGFNIDIDVRFKLKTYFSKNKWMYYLWIENFIEDLEKYLSKEKFMNEINWRTVRTMLQCKE